MDKNKKLERISRKNERLSRQLDAYKERLASEKQINESSGIKINNQINELDAMQQEWRLLLSDLKECKSEYLNLIQELRVMKITLQKEGLHPPFYIRLIDKLRRRR